MAYADNNSAANKSRDGIEAFRNRDFKAALKSFEEAESVAPGDLRLAFDRGCAYAAEGDWEKAAEQFRKSAASADKKLAALSSYNLGCVKVLEAKAKFGEKPEESKDDLRAQGMEMIAAADRHFRDVLAVDSQDEDARYNLETLRCWSRYIQNAWRERERRLRREQLNLLEYLQMLETDQRGLRSKVQELHKIAGDSPRKRQSIREAENAQRELAGEIGPLKEKIEQLAAGQGRGAGQGSGTALPADARKAVEVLKNIADEIGKSMNAAADRLAETALAEATDPQSKAVENIDQIFTAVAPYVPLVQKGIARQEELISSPRPKEEGAGARGKDQETSTKPDRAEAAWNQQFVERYGKIIPYKARQELKQLESQPVAESSTKSSSESTQGGEDAKDEAAAKSQRQRAEMKEALQAGIEFAPKVEQLAREAAELLSQEKSAEALPKQQEALKLLKQMLPKQQQQEQQQKEQEKKEQDKKDQKKKEQQKKDERDSEKNKKDQLKKEQDKKDQEKKEQEKKEQDKKDSQKNDQKRPPADRESASKKEMSKEQAEAMLHRARQRQIEYKEMQKELEEHLYRPEKVEKDW
jgi:hypothetical protein